MDKLTSVSQLPQIPVVYVMYGGRRQGRHVACVGITERLRQRIHQLLVGRDSSVATGASAAGLNPDYVTEIRWWTRPDFSQKEVRQAAELVAFDVFEPALRSRGNITHAAKELYKDQEFRSQLDTLFRGKPSGTFQVPDLQDALE